MAHFAKLGIGNTVEEVIVVNNDVFETEQEGADFINNLYGSRDTWIQTSYNANFRKNFAGKNFKYNASLDAFIPPKPYLSWTLNEETCQWEPPIAYPDDTDNLYRWNEETQTWDVVNIE